MRSNWCTRALFVLLGLASPRAWAGTLALDGGLEYRSLSNSTPSYTGREDVFAERLEAAWRDVMMRRAIGTYHLGFSLEHRDTWNVRRTRSWDWGYDAGVDIWERGFVPITIWANRQYLTLTPAGFPGERVKSENYGFNGALTAPGLPTMRVRAYRNDHDSETAGRTKHRDTRDIAAGISHLAGGLMVLGDLQHRQQRSDPEQLLQLSQLGRMLINYRLDKDATVYASAFSRRYDIQHGGERVRIGTQSAQAMGHFVPAPDWRGSTQASMQQTTQQDSVMGDWALDQRFAWAPGEHLHTAANLGFDSAWQHDAGERSAFYGEHLILDHSWDDKVGKVDYRFDFQHGVAYITDTTLGSGVQAGARLGADAAMPLVGRALTAFSAAQAGSQWDTSPRDIDTTNLDARMGIEAQPKNGLRAMIVGEQQAIWQRSQDEGNSSRTELLGEFEESLNRLLGATYVARVGRHALDETTIFYVSQSVRLNSAPTDTTSLTLDYRHESFSTGTETNIYDRIESAANQKAGEFRFSARYAWRKGRGAIDDRTESVLWLELARGAQWAF